MPLKCDTLKRGYATTFVEDINEYSFCDLHSWNQCEISTIAFIFSVNLRFLRFSVSISLGSSSSGTPGTFKETQVLQAWRANASKCPPTKRKHQGIITCKY